MTTSSLSLVLNTNTNTLITIGASIFIGMSISLLMLLSRKKYEKTLGTKGKDDEKEGMTLMKRIKNLLSKKFLVKEEQEEILKILKFEIGNDFNIDEVYQIIKESLSNHNEFFSNFSVFNLFIEAVVKQSSFEKSILFLENLIENELSDDSNHDKILCTLDVYNSYLKLLCKVQKTKSEDEKKLSTTEASLSSIVNSLKKKNLTPNVYTFRKLIEISMCLNNHEKAWEYYDEMKTFLIEPDFFIYQMMIKSIKYNDINNQFNGRAFEIISTVKFSKLEGFKKDEAFYNLLLDICVKHGNIKLCFSLYEEMIKSDIQITIVTYGIIINALGISHNYDKAFEVFDEMKTKGIVPNEIIYGSLLNVSIKSNNFMKMIEIENDIKANNIKMNIILITTLIKGYTKSKKYNKAFEIYSSLLENKEIKQNKILINAILDCCVESENFEKMNEIYDKFKAKSNEEGEGEDDLKPDVITYSTLIKAYCKAKNIVKALEIYRFVVHDKQMKIDEILYNTLLDGLLKTNKLEQALEIYEDMIRNITIKTNATISIMIKIYSKLNMIDKSMSLYNTLKQKSITPSLITYTSIVQALIKSKNIDKAIEIFKEVIENPIFNPDQVLYNVIVNGCVFSGKLKQAIAFMYISFERNLRLCDDSYKFTLSNILTNKQMCFEDKVEHSKKICQELKKRGVQIEYELYFKIMKLILRNNSHLAKREADEYFSIFNKNEKNEKSDKNDKNEKKESSRISSIYNVTQGKGRSIYE